MTGVQTCALPISASAINLILVITKCRLECRLCQVKSTCCCQNQTTRHGGSVFFSPVSVLGRCCCLQLDGALSDFLIMHRLLLSLQRPCMHCTVWLMGKSSSMHPVTQDDEDQLTCWLTGRYFSTVRFHSPYMLTHCCPFFWGEV